MRLEVEVIDMEAAKVDEAKLGRGRERLRLRLVSEALEELWVKMGDMQEGVQLSNQEWVTVLSWLIEMIRLGRGGMKGGERGG
jgi:hypothetical protein